MLDLIIWLLIILFFVLLYYLKTKWLWLFFILIALSSGIIKFENEGLSAIRGLFITVSLIMAIVKTRREGI